MPTPTTTYSFSKPTVGGDDNAWGTELNNNLDKLDDLLDGTLSIAPNLVGWQVGGVAVTSTAAELNILDGVTASTAEINLLDGVTATTAELNILDGVTATASEINLLDGKTLSGLDTVLITGTAGSSGDIVQWNADGDLVSYGAATQLQATWEAGTGTTESLVSPAKVKAAIDALVPTWDFVSAEQSITLSSKLTVAHGLGALPTHFDAYLVCKTAQSPYVVNEVVLAPMQFQLGANGYSLGVSADATNIYVRVGSQITLNTDVGGVINLTAGSWRIVVRARA